MTDTTAARAAARRIRTAALRRVQPDEVISRALVREASGELRLHGRLLPPSVRVRVLALGKATDAMARAVARILRERVSNGLIVTKAGHASASVPPPRFETVEAAHPLPDERSVAAGNRIAQFLAGGRPDDLVLLLLSGGASALAVRPRPPLRLDDIRAVTDLLQRAGADIRALNAVRKRLDLVKGGGPAAPDPMTWQDAVNALVTHAVWNRAPAAVRRLLEEGVRGSAADTAAPDNAEHAILATARDAAGGLADGGTAARARAQGLDLPAALADNDSYRVLDALGALIRTGPAGTHVNDLGFALIGSGARAAPAPDATFRATAPAE